MANTPLIARDTLAFLLHDWLGHPQDGEMTEILDLSERLANDAFLSHYKAADQREPSLDASGVHVHPAIGRALAQYREAGLFAAGFPEELGGMALPYIVSSASFALFAAANVATSAYVMLTVANARLICAFGTPAQIDQFARPQIEGRWFGTMCLSETHAGSSLADVSTLAVPDGGDALGDRYRLRGSKMWISGGDQDITENIVHLVLAKTAGPDGVREEGTRGISLFVVPKVLPTGERNDVHVSGLNHKMGYRGTANCVLELGDTSGAVGWRIGEVGQGLPQMFQMMNEARIGVGLGAAALGSRSYQLSLAYARERLQGRPPGVRGGPPRPIIEHADVKRQLLAQKVYVEGALALCLYCAKLVDDGDTEILGLLTPIAKTWPSEYALAASDIAIQIHGGYGYTRDFDVEQLYRDNRLNPIHEGTSGIQALDLLGRKLLRDDKKSFRALWAQVTRTCDQATAFPAHAEALRACWTQIDQTIDAVAALPPPRMLDHATEMLWALGHAVVGWMWLAQAVRAAELAHERGPSDLWSGKQLACHVFFEAELPRTAAWLALVASGSTSVGTANPAVF